jgi:MULE transposase domain/MuDR family transposase/SWIM zinc finger
MDFFIGQEFETVFSLRKAIKAYAISNSYELNVINSCQKRYTVCCFSKQCKWRLHASKLPLVPTFQIKTFVSEHSCSNLSHLGHKNATSSWVCEEIQPKLVDTPQYKAKEVIGDLRRHFGVSLPYMRAYRGLEQAKQQMQGSFTDSYKFVRKYCENLLITNPGSSAAIETEENCFKRMFIAFKSCVHAFNSNRRFLITLDGTHIRNKYLGAILIASSLDPEGQLFIVALAVVSNEDFWNWEWFLTHLKTNIDDNSVQTIISDRQKGLIDAVHAVFPFAYHGTCVKHLTENFKRAFKSNDLTKKLWNAAYALEQSDFKRILHEIRNENEAAASWIEAIPAEQWATSAFKGLRFGHITSNLSESVNSWILDARELPLLPMIDSIRQKLMKMFQTRRQNAESWSGILVPSAEKNAMNSIAKARYYTVFQANESVFEVLTGRRTCTVDISNRKCVCKKWQNTGEPCSHATAAVLYLKQEIRHFFNECFMVQTYKEVYSGSIFPVGDIEKWFREEKNTICEVLPPKTKVPPGRPKKKRKKTENLLISRRTVLCSRCKQPGHYKSSCKQPI